MTLIATVQSDLVAVQTALTTLATDLAALAVSLTPPSPVFSYTTLTLSGTVGTALTSDSPIVADFTPTGYSIAPALPAGLALNPATGVISGTPTAASPSTSYTVTAAYTGGTISTGVTIAVAAAVTPPPATGQAGFMALYSNFPPTAVLVANSAAAKSANPWILGARYWVNVEDLCQDGTVSSSAYSADIKNLTGWTSPFQEVMVRLVLDPSATWDITQTAATIYMQQVIAGVVSVAKAAGSQSFLIDPENYSTSTNFFDFSSLKNSGGLTRAQMCAQVRSFGRAVGTALWGALPNAKLYTFDGPTTVIQWTGGGTGIPTSQPDSTYASTKIYNMIPYFFLGLLDACPSTGRIICYNETGSYYGCTGLASFKRLQTAEQNWVSIFFPSETADIAKSATCWVYVPLLYFNPFGSSSSSIYPGAYYVKNATDQLNYFTRQCIYALQMTPSGFMPAIYLEGYDPWNFLGKGASNLAASWETCLANAIKVFNGTITEASLFSNTTLTASLKSDFLGNSAWAAECA